MGFPSRVFGGAVARGPGRPVKLGKTAHRYGIKLFGTYVELGGTHVAPPPSKMRRNLQLSDEVLLVLAKPTHLEIDRQTLEQGTGLLLWVAEFRREFRPWLAAFYHALAAMRPHW